VLFITGASRGIGLAIALRAARDGARIVVAAKTTDPHPKLEGTIFSAAAAIEAAGGEALPVSVDIREPEQIRAAVAQAVERFGGIDILINNASAIQLTGTLETDVKRFDLMLGVNARGTLLSGQACLPHLLRAENPHILCISPPLHFDDHWWGAHLPYTLAKYGMTLCARGWAEEFRSAGVGANTLWPRTTISTAATRMLIGDGFAEHSRKPDIMADAAYYILTQPSRVCTGNYFIDEQVLREVGITDFDVYANAPGTPLFIDPMVDEPGALRFAPPSTSGVGPKLGFARGSPCTN